jgi:hypothetical protein
MSSNWKQDITYMNQNDTLLLQVQRNFGDLIQFNCGKLCARKTKRLKFSKSQIRSDVSVQLAS